MKIIKILLLAIPVILLTGCESGNQNNKYTEERNINDHFYIYTDEETCIEYFVSYGSHSTGIVTPRYDVNGNFKKNGACMYEQNN